MSAATEQCSCGASIVVRTQSDTGLQYRLREWRTEHRHESAPLDLTEETRSLDIYHQEYESQGVIYKPLHGWSCDCDERSSTDRESRLVSSWLPVPPTDKEAGNDDA